MPAPNYKDPYYHERMRNGKTEAEEERDSIISLGKAFMILLALVIILVVLFIFV